MIPFAPPDFGSEEEEAVIRVLRSGWVSRGPECEALEQDLCHYTGASHAISLSSCTSALFLALKALGIGPGDEVAVPTVTFVATVNAVLQVGATPLFLGVGPDYNLSEENLRDVLAGYGSTGGSVQWRRPLLKAIIPVDMHGLVCQLPSFRPEIKVIRDAAHSLGADDPRGGKIGKHDDVTCFSFYATKNVAAGDGGALLTNDPEVAERVRRLSLHGLGKDAWKRYQPGEIQDVAASELGYKCNLADIQAAIARVQLAKLDQSLERRRRAARIYDRFLTPFAQRGLIQLPPAKTCWHLYAIRVLNERRDAVREALAQRSVATGIHFPYLPDLPHLKDCPKAGTDYYGKQLASETLSLPFHSQIQEFEQEQVVAALEAALA